jgi:hypothetical protein
MAWELGFFHQRFVNHMTKHKLYILAFIITVVIIALATVSDVWARTSQKEEDKKIELPLINNIDNIEDPLASIILFPEKTQVFGADFNLVYESFDRMDQKLLDLLEKSNFLVEINNTHIFQLSR